MVKLNKIDKLILATLESEGKELSLEEIADKIGEPTKKTFKSLRKLFQNEFIDTKARKYKILDKQ
jgi:DNA-binding Lrp family transcriptional regulator